MAITAEGLYGLTFEKYLTNAAVLDQQAEDLKVALVDDGYTPDFNLHDFFADLTNEIVGGGYTAGGNTIVATEVTVAAGVLTYDHDDPTWPASSITAAMAAIGYHDAVADELVYLLDFVTAVTTVNGTLTVQIDAAGVYTIDFTP